MNEVLQTRLQRAEIIMKKMAGFLGWTGGWGEQENNPSPGQRSPAACRGWPKVRKTLPLSAKGPHWAGHY